MPIYEYKCNACGRSFDYFVRSSNSLEQLACQSCGSKDLHKLVSGFAFKSSSSESMRSSSGGCGGCSGGNCSSCGH